MNNPAVRRLTASSYAARRLGQADVDCRAAWRARHPAFSPASRVSISELFGIAGTLCCLARLRVDPHFLLQPISEAITFNLEIVVCLQVRPECLAHGKEAG